MANVLGTLSPVLIVQRALDLVFTKRPLLSAIALNTVNLDDGMPTALLNQTVRTRTLSIPPVNDFGTGAQDTAYLDVDVTINKFKEVHLAFTPQEYNGTNRNLVDEAAEPAAVAIANHLVDAIAANWTLANFANQTVVPNGWNYTNTFLAIRNALSARGVPDTGWAFSMNTAVYGSCLADQIVVAAFNNPSNGDAIRSGKLPQVAGLAPMEYPALPNESNCVGFAGTKDSVILATRIPKDPSNIMPGVNYPGLFTPVTNAATGFTVVLNQYIDQATLKANYRILLMYGTAIGRAQNGQRLVTA